MIFHTKMSNLTGTRLFCVINHTKSPDPPDSPDHPIRIPRIARINRINRINRTGRTQKRILHKTASKSSAGFSGKIKYRGPGAETIQTSVIHHLERSPGPARQPVPGSDPFDPSPGPVICAFHVQHLLREMRELQVLSVDAEKKVSEELQRSDRLSDTVAVVRGMTEESLAARSAGRPPIR